MMKTKVFVSLMISWIIFCSNFPGDTSIEGAWRLVDVENMFSDTTFSRQDAGSGVKFWTEGCFTFAGYFRMDTVIYDNYGWGTYTLSDGNHYEEHVVENHLGPDVKGMTLHMLIEIRNDTLIQRWPVDDNWNLQQQYFTEKYVRFK